MAAAAPAGVGRLNIVNLFSFFIPKKTIFHSKINGEIEVYQFLGKRTLYVNGVPQSGGEYVYMWRKVIEKIKNQSASWRTKIKNCLVLGVGGGTAIQVLKKNYPDIIIKGVEIDPVMVEIAQKYFGLTPDSFVDIIIADAYSWVSNYKKKQSFDLIVVDLFIGKFNPKKTRSKGYLLKLKNLLSGPGVILYNAHYQSQKQLEFKKFFTTCKTIFTQVEEVFRYRYNRVLFLK